MDFRQLRYFSAIYEHGTLSRAAEEMRVAISALSHHLANLEAELSAPLFVRKPRGMQPTAAGERLYEHARSILRAVAAAEKDILKSAGEVSGEISVGMAFSAVRAIGVPLMKAVLEQFPNLQLSLTENLSAPTLSHLESSEVDLALAYNPPANPKFKLLPLLEEKLICVGLPAIIGDSTDPIDLDDMLELPIILLRQGISNRALMEDVVSLKKLESRARLQLNSVFAITGSLKEGLGCTVGTHLVMREELERGELHARPITSPELSRTIYLCEMADRPATFAREAVMSLIYNLVAEAVETGFWRGTTMAQKSGDWSFLKAHQ